MEKKIWKTSVMTLLMAFILLLSACGQSTNSTSIEKEKDTTQVASRVEEIKKAGKIVLGTSADYPPYEFHAIIDGEDKIVGFDIATAEKIAEELGVKLEIKDMDFSGLLAALQMGKVDFVMAGMTPDPERSESVDFSKVYYKASHGILINKANVDKYKTVEDLKGKKVGAQQGAIQEEIAQSEIPDVQLKSLAKIPDLVLEVKHNKIDAVVMELPVAQSYVKANDDIVLIDYVYEDNEGGSAVAVQKGNTELVEAINKVLDRLIEDGSIDQFVIEANEIADQL